MGKRLNVLPKLLCLKPYLEATVDVFILATEPNAKDSSDFDLEGARTALTAVPLIATGDPHLLCVAGLFGNEAELEKLSSNLDSERKVDTDLAEPELMDPVPVRNNYY